MSKGSAASRRTVLAAALAVTATVSATSAASATGLGAKPSRRGPGAPPDGTEEDTSTVAYRGWSTAGDWSGGQHQGTRTEGAALVLRAPQGTVERTDPHTGETATWEYATWLAPLHRPLVPASELIASWNAHTPSGSWMRIEVQATYGDDTTSPWYTLGIWASGDQDVRRTSVGGQGDGRSSVFTDTLVIDDRAGGLRIAGAQLRVTLYRAPGTTTTPTVHRVGMMTSDVPDRFEVPASLPGEGAGVELAVPRYSQNVHVGRYPEYDNGGEAWCSPTSTQMIVEYWGRRPTPEDLAWVRPEYDDPQVCHAARYTFDYQYQGCGNWPFNAAYAATYPDLQAIVTRLDSLTDAEALIAAGIPLVTSQSFLESELDGAGYGTAGHLMTVIGFTAEGDVIANDPASADNEAVRRVYPRRQWENIWLRTQRYDADGSVKSGTGGICYVLTPRKPAARQRRVLRSLGIR